jgi:hypothetical protein
VAFIARLLQAGDQAPDIIAAYPHLSPAAVYDAISFYFDHRDEIDAIIADAAPEALAKKYGIKIADKGRIVFEK